VRYKIDFGLAAALLIVGFSLLSVGQAVEVRFRTFVVNRVWSRPTPPTATVGVVYFSITNMGHSTDSLIGVTSSIAEKVELHESRNVQGVVEMRAMTAVEFPPSTIVKSEPGGLHMMLIGLTHPLVAGTSFALSLEFRDAGVMTLQVPVVAGE
jgi:periplasmic copper chaperone A